jgi:hypothetical protein
MKISIAMATYKGERFLREQLDSIARQTLPPFELVITDDSPDSGTREVVLEFARRVSFPVRVYRNERRLGFRANFFRAISFCEGDCVAFCDQDDVWMDNKLERVAKEFADPDVLLVVHGVTVVDGDLKPRGDNTASHWSYRGKYAPLTTNPWYVLFGMSAVVRRSIYEYIDWRDRPEHPIDPGFAMSHDTWAWFVASSLGSVVAIDEPLALYRQHDDQSCGVAPDRDMRQKVRMARVAGETRYRRMATAASRRADKMRHVSRDASASVRERAARAVVYYHRLGERLQRRAELYSAATSTVRRAGTVLRLLVSGAYRTLDHGGLGHRALLKDVHATVFRVSIE